MNSFLCFSIVFCAFFAISFAGQDGADNGNRTCVCGVENIIPRIVDGRTMKPLLYPWMTALINGQGENFCGASLLTDRHLLTAAHCVQGKAAADFQAVMGVHDLKTAAASDKYDLSRITVHPEYAVNGSVQTNDLAIVELKEAVQFSNNVRPICLPDVNLTEFEYRLTVIGWGQLSSEAKNKAQRLQELTLPEVSSKKCTSTWNIDIGPKRLCHGKAAKNICKGDDGGPLMYLVNDTYFQVGVASFVGPTCGDQFPGVYMRVTSYLDWIRGQLNGTKICPAADI